MAEGAEAGKHRVAGDGWLEAVSVSGAGPSPCGQQGANAWGTDRSWDPSSKRLQTTGRATCSLF